MATQAERLTERRARSSSIVAAIRAVLPAALADHPIAAVYVYGSVARGTVLPLSDLDLAVVTTPLTFASEDTLELAFRIQADIEDTSRSTTEETLQLPELDVRIINEAPLTVRGHILHDAILVYEGDHRARVEFEVATRKRYFDFAPTERRLRKAFLNHIREKGMLYG